MVTEQPISALATKIAAKRAGKSIRVVSKEIGISPATLSRVENGNVPDLETFRKICVWLKEDPGAVLGVSTPASPALEVRVHFRKDRAVSQATATALGEMILHAQRAMQESEEF
jgi:transcriptional regulator with XRE-family HTH domain